MLLKLCILILSLIGIAYLGVIAFAYYFADGMIFPDIPSSYEDLPGLDYLETADGERIAYVYLPAAEGAPLLLYSHGNGEDIGSIYPILQRFEQRGIAVLAYDYPGYGRSSGRPSEAGVFQAAQTAYQHATETLGYPSDHITLYGRSLGSGPSSWLATHYPVNGVILEGAFSSTFRVITKIKILPFDTFDNLSRLKASQCPVLILHGERDITVPFAHGLAILKAVGDRGSHLWLPEAGHNDIIEVAGIRYWETVLPFIKRPLIK